MHSISVLMMFCSATCGAACSADNEWSPKSHAGDSDECKAAKENHCIAKPKHPENKFKIAEAAAQTAVDQAKAAWDLAKLDLQKAKNNVKKNKVNAENQKLSACWTMESYPLDRWLEKLSTVGQCANKQGDVINAGFSVWTETIDKCIQMLVDSPMAVGLSWQPKSYAGLPYGGLSGACRVLYENSMGHITQTDGHEGFECYRRKSAHKSKKNPPVTEAKDVSLEKVEGQGYCANSNGEANYYGTTTSKHIVTTESTCFQMFAHAPEAVGMYYYHPDSRCRVLYDRYSIGEITQSSGTEGYSCYKRSTPADNRRLHAEEALPMV